MPAIWVGGMWIISGSCFSASTNLCKCRFSSLAPGLLSWIMTSFPGGSSGRPMWCMSVSGDKIKMHCAFELHAAISGCEFCWHIWTWSRVCNNNCLLAAVVSSSSDYEPLILFDVLFHLVCEKNWVNRRLHVWHFSVSFHFDGISASLKNTQHKWSAGNDVSLRTYSNLLGLSLICPGLSKSICTLLLPWWKWGLMNRLIRKWPYSAMTFGDVPLWLAYAIFLCIHFAPVAVRVVSLKLFSVF